MNNNITNILLISLAICIMIYLLLCIREEQYKRKLLKRKLYESKKDDYIVQEMEVEEEVRGYSCEHCGADVSEEDEYCPECGYYFAEELDDTAEEEKEYTCEHCGADVSEEDDHCPKCGFYFVDELEEKIDEKLYTCEHCGADVLENDKYCPECGFYFVDNSKEIKEEKDDKPFEIKNKYIDVKFLNYNKIYTYLAPYKCDLRKGDYCIINQDNKEQKVKIVSDVYYELLNDEHIYKELNVVRKIDEKDIYKASRAYEPRQAMEFNYHFNIPKKSNNELLEEELKADWADIIDFEDKRKMLKDLDFWEKVDYLYRNNPCYEMYDDKTKYEKACEDAWILSSPARIYDDPAHPYKLY